MPPELFSKMSFINRRELSRFLREKLEEDENHGIREEDEEDESNEDM